MQECNVCVPLEDQTYGNTMLVQRDNNMGMYEGHMGHDASTQDPSYVDVTRVAECIR